MIKEPPSPPAGLRMHGKRLWEDVVAVYVLTPAELSVLTECCRTTDELNRLESAVRKLPELMVAGSTGQPKAHPLLEEVRRHRALLERLCAGLNLPDETQQIGLRGSSRHAQKAAAARWGRRDAKGAADGDVETAARG
jgi:hypothetical protein